MIRFKELLTGKEPNRDKPVVCKETVNKQIYAAAMAWQILTEYPSRRKPKEWEKYKNLRAVILADEVGGGKTFEALAIISKAFLSKKRGKRSKFRVLIIAAPSIMSKWQWCTINKEDCKKKNNNCVECNKKRKNKLDIYNFLQQTREFRGRDRLENFFRPDNPKEYEERIIRSKKKWENYKKFNKKRQGIWLTSINALPTTKGKKENATFERKRYKLPKDFFNWIIVDEAHIVKSGYLQKDGDENIPAISNSAIRKIFAVLNSNPKAKLLLLTATPFQNNINEFIQIIKLTEKPQSKGEGITNIIEKALKNFQSEIDKLKDNEIDEKFLENLYLGLDKDISKLLKSNKDNDNKINIERPKELRKRKKQSGLDDFLRDIVIRNTKEKLTINIIKANLDEKGKMQYLFLRDLVYSDKTDADEQRSMVSINLSELVSSPKAFERSLKEKRKRLYNIITEYFASLLPDESKNSTFLFEAKYSKLIEEINKISDELKRRNVKKRVIVIYCRFIPTLKLLEHLLKEDKYKVYQLIGETDVKERPEILKKIKNENNNNKSEKPILFLVSQVGNEGLDFDEFSENVIHFDGHYNPAVIDQRNGRVYRRDNSHKNIKVRHIIIQDTYDQRIKFIEEEKRKMKDFYLGDAEFNILLDKILTAPAIRKDEYFKKLSEVRIDLEPNKENILKKFQKEI